MSTSTNVDTLYVLYNANGSILGELSYAVKKLTHRKTEEDPSICSACDLTHGGLSLTERPGWTTYKRSLTCKVVQWHRDQVKGDVKTYLEEKKPPLPCILSRIIDEKPHIEMFMTRKQVNTIGGDLEEFDKALKLHCEQNKITLIEYKGKL